MAEYQLKNEKLEITVRSKGAELISLKDCTSGREYMWSGNPEYWNRVSPILFPIVGGLKNNQYTYEDKTYSMGKHGFARDLDFNLIQHTDSVIWFSVENTPETLEQYPFRFLLAVGYQLEGANVKVMWRVVNEDNKEMHFSIGGHPGFVCPHTEGEKQTDYFISFGDKKSVVSSLITPEGLTSATVKTVYELKDGLLPIAADLFDQDALVIENSQTNEVSLADANKKPYIKVSFQAPLFGVWSPTKKNAPFVCIEPWYGRCDSEDFDGSLQDRVWENHLEKGCMFETEYNIELLV